MVVSNKPCATKSHKSSPFFPSTGYLKAWKTCNEFTYFEKYVYTSRVLRQQLDEDGVINSGTLRKFDGCLICGGNYCGGMNSV